MQFCVIVVLLEGLFYLKIRFAVRRCNLVQLAAWLAAQSLPPARCLEVQAWLKVRHVSTG